MNINLSRFFGCLVLGVLVLTIAGQFSCPAYASGQPQTNDEKKTTDQQVLLASAAPASNPPAAPVPAPPPPASSGYRWTGFYVGVNGGYGAGRGDTDVIPLPTEVQFVNLRPVTLHPDPTGMVGGAQVGANWESGGGAIVLGAEADYSATNMSASAIQSPIIQDNGTPFPGITTTGHNRVITRESTNWFSTIRGRFGTAIVPRLFVYATGGMAFGHVSYSADSDFTPAGTEHYTAISKKTKSGWTAGVGAEIGLWKRWSVKGEYLYYDLGNETVTANPSIPFGPGVPPFQVRYIWETKAHIARGGLNFRF